MRGQSSHFSGSKFFSSKLLLLTLLILVIFIGYSIFKEKRNEQETVRNIKSLEQQMTDLESQSLELAEMIKYLRSEDFVEREAREKLNLQKPGEKVVIVPAEENPETGAAGKEDLADKKNWQLWFEYFFGNR
jgi:cell division protein DivIC